MSAGPATASLMDGIYRRQRHIYDLTRRDASALLDELNGRQRKAA